MSYDVSEKPEDALDLGPDDRDDDQPNHAPTLPADEPYEPHAPNGDPQDEPEEEHDEPEPDGRWVQAHGCWLYE